MLGVTLAAAATGAVLTKPLLALQIDQQSTRNGPWRTSITTGSAAANPWQRAAVALAGLYALSPQEAVYFTAFTDSSGAALRGECRYRVQGQIPSARWWSVTVYGADHYLVPNPEHRYAQSAGTLPARADGSIDIAVAADASGPGTLPSPASGPYSLTLRLYNPPAGMLSALATTPLPRIVPEGCA